MNKDVASRTRTKAILEKHGLSLKKSLGQHFLVDSNVLEKIVGTAQLSGRSGVIEIGPGIGALTEKLAKKARKVVAIEIDRRLLPVLQETMAEYPNVQIIHADILKTDINQVIQERFCDQEDMMIVANLPYYITTPILMKLLEDRLSVRGIVCMIQKEVADRISASPGSKDYGSLSIAVRYYADAKTAFSVPPHVFMPKPNVASAVVKLVIRRNPPVLVTDEAMFFAVVRAAFSQRRKTVLNSLAGTFKNRLDRSALENVLKEAGIDPLRRGETLSIEEFANVSNKLKEHVFSS